MATTAAPYLREAEIEQLLIPSRYDPSKLFNSGSQWANQFAKRFCYDQAPLESKKRYALELLEDPLRVWEFKPTIPTSSSSFNTNSIYPLSWDDIDRLQNSSSECIKTSTQSIDDWAVKNQLPFAAFGYLKVYLNASDEDIIRDLTDWLHRYRSHVQRSSPLSGFKELSALDGFGGFYDNLILPYFDINLYCQTHGRRISGDRFIKGFFKTRASLPHRNFLAETQRLIEEHITLRSAIALTMK